MARGIFNGRFINIDYSGVELTEELMEAMEALDSDCQYGSGGTWEIYEEEPEHGVPYRAIFIDMATDELVWNSEAGTWTDGTDDEDEDEDEEELSEDEEHDYQSLGPDPAAY
jgi:hypothetical protein